MNDISKIIKNLLSKGNTLKIIIFIGFAGMGLILLSEILPKKSDEAKTTSASAGNSEISYSEEYGEKAEKRLSELLSSIEGVGKAEIMLNVASTEEYVYAEEEDISRSQNGGGSSVQNKDEYVMIEQNGEKEALVKKIICPQISGVVIVCEGGDSNTVREAISRSVSALFDISVNNIYISKLSSKKSSGKN